MDSTDTVPATPGHAKQQVTTATSIVKKAEFVKSPGGRPQLNIELENLTSNSDTSKEVKKLNTTNGLDGNSKQGVGVNAQHDEVGTSTQHDKADTSAQHDDVVDTNHHQADSTTKQAIPSSPMDQLNQSTDMFDSDSDDSLDIPDNETLLRKYGLIGDTRESSSRWNSADVSRDDDESSIDSPPQSPQSTSVAEANNSNKTDGQQDLTNAASSNPDTVTEVLPQQITPKPPSFEQVFGVGFETVKSANEELIAALDAKDRQLELMAAKLLAANVQVPNVDGENIPFVDNRDQKIVQLARKTRTLHQALGKERGKVATLQKKLDEAKQQISVLSNAPGAGATNALSERARLKSNSHSPRPSNKSTASSGTNDTGRSVQEWASRVEGLRSKLDQTNVENRRLKHVLMKEVGEGKVLDKLLESCTHVSHSSKNDTSDSMSLGSEMQSWKGRAEKLVVMKAKMKRMKNELAKLKADSGLLPSQATKTRKTIDDRAVEDIRELERERRESVDQIAKDNQQLDEYCTTLKKKVQANKARIATLETEKKKFKSSLKLLVNKSTTDDQLISAQRQEISKLKEDRDQLEEQCKAAKGDTLSTRNKTFEITNQMKNQLYENQRLENLVGHLRNEVSNLRAQLSKAKEQTTNLEMRRKVNEANDSIVRVENERLCELVQVLKATQQKLNATNSELLERSRIAERDLKATRCSRGVSDSVASGHHQATSIPEHEKPQRKRSLSKIPSRGGKKNSVAPGCETRIPSASNVLQNVQALKEALQFEVEENEALKASAREALAAKEKEIDILRNALQDTKRSFATAMKQFNTVQPSMQQINYAAAAPPGSSAA